MSAVYHVVLRDTQGQDPFGCRRFILPMDVTFAIGRASRNASKPELMPAPHNAFIDSPVVSRDHAALSATGSPNLPRIFIADTKSMHGTFVNGERLKPNTPKCLASGDIIQFGVDVNRNEEFFNARTYAFEAHLMPQGYSVPDGEGEDIAGTAPPRGSQNNPLTIEDSDAESETPDNEQAETTMFGEGLGDEADEADQGQLTSSLHEAYAQPISDHEESVGDYQSDHLDSDIEQDLHQDMGRQASDIDESEAGYNSDYGVHDLDDIEAEMDADSEAEAEAAIEEFEAAVAPAPTPFSAFVPPWALRESSTVYNPTQSPNRSELPSMSSIKEAIDSSVSNNTFPPPFPRPSAFCIYNRGDGAHPQQANWRPNDTLTFSEYLGTNHGDRPSLFSPAPLPTMSSTQEADVATPGLPPHSANFAPINNGTHARLTPPSMPTSDFMSSTPLAGRRTGVSITDIVEEQPPTPESVNDMKRKADVLDTEETPEAEADAIVAAERHASAANAAEVKAEVDAAVAAIIASRPKKQPRSLLKKLGRTATVLSYGAMGAAGALALLTCLPDAFFA